jgi:hypothetical protein
MMDMRKQQMRWVGDRIGYVQGCQKFEDGSRRRIDRVFAVIHDLKNYNNLT